jgi:hypothetical protein
LISGQNLKENAMPGAATQGKQTSDPIDRIHNMSERLTEFIDCLRADIGRVEEPQFKAMLRDCRGSSWRPRYRLPAL